MNIQRNKKKNIRKKFLLIIISFLIFIYFFKTSLNSGSLNKKIHLDDIIFIRNSNINIVGQKKISNFDGYTTKFTTLNNKRTYIEYKQNQNATWSEKSYWGGTMRENGCGITSLAIICSGYKLNVTPEYFRKKYYPHLASTEIQNSLINLGINCSEFYFDSKHINLEIISKHLKSNSPVLIAVNSNKANKWTKASHYMVLLDIDSKGNFYLSNPNGQDGTKTASNWYNPDEIIPYVAKIMFIY